MYNIQYIPPIPHIASSMSSTSMWHDSAGFSQITMHCFKYTSVTMPLIWLLKLRFPQCQKRIFTAKPKYEIHLCIFYISKCRHFSYCHCSCYWYYTPILKTALQLSVLPWIQSLSNDYSTTRWHQHKNIRTQNQWKKLKKCYSHFLFQTISPTTS